MKVAELTQSEPVRSRLSAENKTATASIVAMDTAPRDPDRVKEVIRTAEKVSNLSNRSLKFEYHEEADMFQVSVVDENDEVIRKIPADSVLRMVANIEKMIGLNVDAKA